MTIRREDLEAVDFSDIVDPGAGPIPHPRPGEILREIMQDQKLAARALARDIGVPVTRITEILHGERAITAETAIKLGRRFGMSAESWMGLQMAFDLAEARAKMAA